MPKEMTDADDRRDHPRSGRCRGRVRCRPCRQILDRSTTPPSSAPMQAASRASLVNSGTRSRASSGRPSGNGKPSIVRTDGLSTRRSIDPLSARTLKATWSGWRPHGWTIPHTVNAASNVHVRLPGGDVPRRPVAHNGSGFRDALAFQNFAQRNHQSVFKPVFRQRRFCVPVH